MSELIYRYCDENGINILLGLKLRLKPPEDFNDPFKVSPFFDEEEMKKQIDIKFEIDRVVQFWRNLLIEDGYQSHQVATKELLKKAVYEFHKNDYENSCSKFQSKISKRMGVICFSTIYNDILLWSHYTNQHKGMVIGFDIDKLAPDPRTRITVSYDCEKIKVPIFIDPEDFKQHLENINFDYTLIFKRKYIQWKYENEIRLIGGLEEMGKDGKYHVDITPEMISAIYLGCRADFNLQKMVRIILEKDEFKHINLFKMAISKSHFKLLDLKK